MPRAIPNSIGIGTRPSRPSKESSQPVAIDWAVLSPRAVSQQLDAAAQSKSLDRTGPNLSAQISLGAYHPLARRNLSVFSFRLSSLQQGALQSSSFQARQRIAVGISTRKRLRLP